jgi:hypothetical protein
MMKSAFSARKRSTLVAMSRLALASLVCSRSRLFALGQSESTTGFPAGFDAVQVAPNSHRVLFENQFVRVLEVTVPPGTKEPMHHHRWPSIFLIWDTGGRTAHERFYHADGSVHDVPSRVTPVKPGSWHVQWMNPEPMHSVENLDTPESAKSLPPKPPTVRVEFKFFSQQRV